MTVFARWEARQLEPSTREETFDNASWAAARPRLSVLIPFLKDDPTRLVRALDGADEAELIVLDDGTNDDMLAARVAEAALAVSTPARFVRRLRNEGRAASRNRLARHARGKHLLFLDSDMLPDHRDYLDVWLRVIASRDPAIAFGGVSTDGPGRPRAEHALARALAQVADCRTSMQRGRLPEKHVVTSNLLVRRDVFEAEPFDESFRGWGWEDVEWTLRAGRRHPILHVDNSATHLGLDAPVDVARKYEQSTANFARVLAAHRDVVHRSEVYRFAWLMKWLPGRRRWRPWVKAAALAEPLPLKLRAAAMQAYRAALYAEAL